MYYIDRKRDTPQRKEVRTMTFNRKTTLEANTYDIEQFLNSNITIPVLKVNGTTFGYKTWSSKPYGIEFIYSDDLGRFFYITKSELTEYFKKEVI